MLSFYLSSLLYLLLVLIAGHVYTFYFLKQNATLLFKLIVGYFVFASGCAIITTHGITIAWGVVMILLYIIFIQKRSQQLELQDHHQSTRNDLLILFALFNIFFLSRYWVQFNPISGLSNIPYRDYVYYINSGEYFQLTGIENKLTSKNLLFPEISFRELYRFQDTWPMSFWMAFTSFKAIDVYYVILYPVNYALVSYAAVEVIRYFVPKVNIVFVFLFGFFFVFFQSSSFWPYKIGDMMMGVAGYTKLWLHYLVMAFCIIQISKKNEQTSYLFLLMLFFVVPVTLSIMGFLLFIVIKDFFLTRKISALHWMIIVSATFFFSYYFINKQIEYSEVAAIKAHLSFSLQWQSYLTALINKSLLFAYITPVIILSLVFKLLRIPPPISLDTFGLFSIFLGISYVLYVVLNNTNDALQLYSNVAAPICAIISIVFIIFLIFETKISLLRISMLITFIAILSYESIVAHTRSHHYARFNITELFDPNFVNDCKSKCEKLVKNPVGIYYPGIAFGTVSEQHVRDIEFNLTLLLGRYYDVVNIKGDSVLNDPNRYRRIDIEANRMALNIFHSKNPEPNRNIELDFVLNKKIDFVFTKRKSDQLPSWLTTLFEDSVIDPKSGLRVYFLDTSNH